MSTMMECKEQRTITARHGGVSFSEQALRHMAPVYEVLTTSPIDHMLSTAQGMLGPAPPQSESSSTTPQPSSQKWPQTPLQGLSKTELAQHLGVLDFPHSTLRTEFLRAFLQYVQAGLPCVDDHVVNSQSALLAWAALSASCPFVPIAAIHQAGYSTRLEDEPIIQIQSLLLISLWEEDSNGPKGAAYWLGLAISTATRIGLHEDATDRDSPSKRRLWWCLYTRDVQIALAYCRPCQITIGLYSPLTLSPLTKEDLEPVEGESPGHPISQASDRLQLATIFVQKAHYYIGIARWLHSVYETSWKLTAAGDVYQTMTLRKEVSRLDLREHQRSLKACIREINLNLDEPGTETHPAVVVQHMALRIECICSQWVLLPANVLRGSYEYFPAQATASACEIVSDLRSLYTSKLIQYLPMTCMAALYFATRVLSLHLATREMERDARSFASHMVCVALLRALQGVHPLPDVDNPLFPASSRL
ncbi:hypothetical protein BJY04DRAFT_219767 [Aspergillus karnatakaensis]|uniref:fungal specific transcription factor domain-containing protein n=1 Tax=Aspergillus karnatakaensis TaxID=1810916 RepID=UPI003CCCBFD0